MKDLGTFKPDSIRRQDTPGKQAPDVDTEHSEVGGEMTYTRAVGLFLSGAARGLMTSKSMNERLFCAIKTELERRAEKHGSDTESSDVAQDDWDMYTNKLLPFRPRLIGALGAYAALGNISIGEVQKNGGLDMFRMMWFLGASQDDLIDAYQNPSITDKKEIAKELRKIIFGSGRVFYQAAFTVVANELKASDLDAEAKTYLRQKFAGWYRFLVNQEAEVMTKDFEGMNYEYCKQYREQQNQHIGEVLVACLNGKQCLNPKFQELENLVPKLSFRTQIIDDIADIPEDLESRRPSYAVGALNENKDELVRVIEHMRQHKVGKCTPRLFHELAPRSSLLVEQEYRRYGEELAGRGVAGKMLDSIGSAMFDLYPKFRDTMYKISPKFSNF